MQIAAGKQGKARLRLSGLASKADLSNFIGVLPSHCVASSETTELCQWKATKEHRGWVALSKAIGTAAQVSVVCNLPVDGSARYTESCGVYPLLSNRGAWRIKSRGSSRKERSQADKLKGVYWTRADMLISAAQTLVQLSHLTGTVPDSCTQKISGQQECLWHMSRYSFGHGTVATWSNIPVRKQIEFRCRLPLDGGNREAGSCSARLLTSARG
jgi:hypothetical protein